jgi:hypothetical protein
LCAIEGDPMSTDWESEYWNLFDLYSALWLYVSSTVLGPVPAPSPLTVKRQLKKTPEIPSL